MKACSTVVMIITVTLLTACGGSIKGPDSATLKKDLVGREFFYQYEWGSGGRRWQVKPDQVVDLQVQNRLTDSSSGTEEIHALTTLSDGRLIIKGTLSFKYKKYDQGWVLQDVDAKDGGLGKSYSFDVQSRDRFQDAALVAGSVPVATSTAAAHLGANIPANDSPVGCAKALVLAMTRGDAETVKKLSSFNDNFKLENLDFVYQSFIDQDPSGFAFRETMPDRELAVFGTQAVVVSGMHPLLPLFIMIIQRGQLYYCTAILAPPPSEARKINGGINTDGATLTKEINIAAVNAAKEQWAIINNKASGTPVVWTNISAYIGNGITSQSGLSVGRSVITLNPVGTSASY